MHKGIERLFTNIRSVFLGHDESIILALASVLAKGHLLIEDAPGLGKTLLARALSQSIDLKFRRIQFTPDLLPSDVTGVSIYNQSTKTFEFAPGPVFTQVLLADEINRGSPRTQSSLLETMQERQVTVDGKSRPLDRMFFVVATQNPVEYAGTFPLPEAQLDRFLLKISLGFPDATDEIRILDSHRLAEPVESLSSVMSADEFMALQDECANVQVSPAVMEYIVGISAATREHPALSFGMSPRGSLALMKAAQAYSLIQGLDYVNPDAVKAVAASVCCHRIDLDPHQTHLGINAHAIIEEILGQQPVPLIAHE